MTKHDARPVLRISDRVRIAAEYAKMGITVTITPDGAVTASPAVAAASNDPFDLVDMRK